MLAIEEEQRRVAIVNTRIARENEQRNTTRPGAGYLLESNNLNQAENKSAPDQRHQKKQQQAQKKNMKLN